MSAEDNDDTEEPITEISVAQPAVPGSYRFYLIITEPISDQEVTSHPYQGKRLRIVELVSPEITIGREARQSKLILYSETVSRAHCVMTIDSATGAAHLQDLKPRRRTT